jgi:small subunit ribosomal protein S9
MMEEPKQPEGEAPEDEEAPTEGAPGEPGEGTPSDSAPAPDETPEDTPAASSEDPAPAAGAPEERPADAEAPGAEVEGLDKLDQATTSEAEEPAGDAAPAAEERPRPRAKDKGAGSQEDVIPGAHLEPDLVLDEQRSEEGEYGEYAQYADADGEPALTEDGEPVEAGGEPAPVAHTPLELAADARYNATGKRKSAIARVILKPGEGTYTVNGRHLDEYFPRVRLQRMASQPLEAAGYATRMDVVARIHGGGVSAQANALRHGIARALVEADPALRTELKRRGYLTRDPREKERKKAGLKKARKRPQFSKR